MDIKDMILVSENDRGTDINMLMTLDDYKSFIAIDDMSELAENLLQLGRLSNTIRREASRGSIGVWAISSSGSSKSKSFVCKVCVYPIDFQYIPVRFQYPFHIINSHAVLYFIIHMKYSKTAF